MRELSFSSQDSGTRPTSCHFQNTLQKFANGSLRDARCEDLKAGCFWLPPDGWSALIPLPLHFQSLDFLFLFFFPLHVGGKRTPGAARVKQMCGNWREHQGRDERWAESPPATPLPVSVFTSQGWWGLSAWVGVCGRGCVCVLYWMHWYRSTWWYII